MIRGKKHWLWRAVDQDGVVLDVLVQSRRDKRAAKRLLRKLSEKQCRAPRVMVTDKLASYGAAKSEVMPSVEHRKHKGLNNRAENSHQPTRRRERQMKRIKDPRRKRRGIAVCRCPSMGLTPQAAGNVTQRDSSRRARLNASSPLTIRSTISSTSAAITSLPPNTEPARTQAFQTWAAVTGVAARA